jgi:hypothetical protein
MATVNPESNRRQFIDLCQIRDLSEALLAKSVLDSAGIECFLGDENMVRMDWFWSNLLGGVKLWVREEDAETASSLLDQNTPDRFDVEGIGEYKQPRCPNCQSFDISFEGLKRTIAYTSAFLGVPYPFKGHGWKCHSCGHEWPETSEIPKQSP